MQNDNIFSNKCEPLELRGQQAILEQAKMTE